MNGLELLEFLQKLPKELLENARVYYDTDDNPKMYYDVSAVSYDNTGDIILKEK